MRRALDGPGPFAEPLCYALLLPGLAGWAAWFVVPRLVPADHGAGMLVVPFWLALAATAFAAAMISLTLRASRRATAINLVVNVGWPVFLIVVWLVQGL